jgi:hypothetical protein
VSYFGGFARPGEPDPFTPFSYQREFMDYMSTHTPDDPAHAICVWPRRHGKDMVALFQMLCMAHDAPGVYWHGLPTYEQARKSCWMAFRNDTNRRLMDSVFPREIRRRPSEFSPQAEMLVELHNGSIIQFVGSDSIDSIVGSGPRGLNASEYSLWKPSAYDYVRPMLREAKGWSAFLFTPRGRNHAYKMLERARRIPRWHTSHLNIFTAGRYTEDEAKKIMTDELREGMLEELVRQEYLCDFGAALVGSYWGDLIENVEARGDVETAFDYQGTPVFVAWDLGISDMTAMWAWTYEDDQFSILAHYQSHNQPLSHYFDKIDEWAKELGFKFEAMQLPHDARQRTLQTGVSVVDQFIARFSGTKIEIQIVKQLDLIDGIHAVRWLLQQRLRFHPRCSAGDGVEALRQYHRRYDEDRRVFMLTPEHDWSSHSSDGFRYLAISAKQIAGHLVDRKRAEEKPRPRVLEQKAPLLLPANGWASGPTLDDLWADNEGRGRHLSGGRA